MANVMFKRGTQASLNNLTSFVDGAFYLTTDTDRLYVAQSATELVELNKSITVVNTLNDLPLKVSATSGAVKGNEVAVGQFYYVKSGSKSISGNILAVCSSIDSVTGDIEWTQVNPDTVDGNDYVSEVSVTNNGVVKNTQTNEDELSYTITLKQATKDGQDIPTKTITGDFKVLAKDIVKLGNVAVDIDAATGTTSGKEVVLGLGGPGADDSTNAGKVTLKGGNTVSITTQNNVVTIDAQDTRYTMGKAANSNAITLNNGDTDVSTVSIKADETYLTIDKTKANELTVNHKTKTGLAGTYGEAGKTLPHKDSDSVTSQFSVPKITIDAAGHITSASSETFVLPVDNDTKYTVIAPVAGATAGTITVGINDKDKDITATSDRILYNTITVYDVGDNATATKQPSTVYNTESLGTFYSKAAIDKMMQGLDALTYKGTVGTNPTSLPTTNVAIGDTYKVDKAGTYAGKEAAVGDLLIATGTEGANGYISGTITWTYVGTNAEADTTYTLSATSNKITLTDSTDQHKTNEVEIIGGTALTASTSNNKITINHDASGVTASTYGPATTSTTTSTLGYGGKFKVPSITVDAQGHITSASSQEYAIPTSDDTKYHLIGTPGTNTIELATQGDNISAGKFSITADDDDSVAVATTGTDADGYTIKVSHVSVTKDVNDGKNTNASQSAYGGTFTAVTAVTSNTDGHVTGVQTTTYKLPNEVTYALNTDTANKTVELKKNNEAAVGSLKFASSYTTADGGIKIDVTGNQTANAVATIDMVWGTF